MKHKQFLWKEVSYPEFQDKPIPTPLTNKTMNTRKEKVLLLMKEKGLDCIVVYCDLEHGSNFEYLTGFLTRFEESALVLHKTGEAYLLIGNENTKMVAHSRIPAQGIHVPFFSLPNQPMLGDAKLSAYLESANITKEMTVGIVGWKLFTSQEEINSTLLDVPHYLVEAIRSTANCIVNATDIFIDPQYGARITNNANEIAHYEFGASLASDGMLAAMDAIALGKSEMEVAWNLQQYGQHPSVVSICATGQRFEYANLYPSNKPIQLGDRMSLTVGYKGGLSSRSGYAVEDMTQLPSNQQDYLDVIAGPYFVAIAKWLQIIHIGMVGKDLYRFMQDILPQDKYNWEWNPGHLTGDEEWMSTPVYHNSKAILQSGMMFQVDVIPSMPGYAGVSTECTIALADTDLRKEIQTTYPKLWATILKRQAYVREELGIAISDEVLPLQDTVAYWRPFLLNKTKAMVFNSQCK